MLLITHLTPAITGRNPPFYRKLRSVRTIILIQIQLTKVSVGNPMALTIQNNGKIDYEQEEIFVFLPKIFGASPYRFGVKYTNLVFM